MAPVASTVDMAMSHLDGISDSARARELYKYYQPNIPSINLDSSSSAPNSSISIPDDGVLPDVKVKSDFTSSKISSPDHALTAFCQLTAWRAGAQRAMISVIDANNQYFLAESTKTVDLEDNTKHATGDEIWMGCATVTKAGRLCERTIAVTPTKSGSYPCFIVNDLTKDERFNTLPFVTGPPYLKFYAGVPLVTKRGIPIGSLFVVNDKPGNGLDQETIRFMNTMGRTIMRHMEMVRELEEHRRGMKMSRGLASFVEGRGELAEADAYADNTEGAKIVGQFETEPIVRTRSKGSTVGSHTSAIGSTHSMDKAREYSASLTKVEQEILASHELSESPAALGNQDLESFARATSYEGTNASVSNASVSSPQGTLDKDKISTPGAGEELSETSTMKLLFSRSANLIREAFEVDGGAVFYDAQSGFSSNFKRPVPGDSSGFEDSHPDNTEDSHNSGEDSLSGAEFDGESKKPTPSLLPARSNSPGLGEGAYSRDTDDTQKLAEVLGFSTPDATSFHGDPLPGPHSFSPFAEKALHVLLRRYPRGKLWTFDSDGAVSSSSEDEYLRPLASDPIRRSKDIQKRRVRGKRTKSGAIFLSGHFTGVRQLLFVPLWDAARSRWLSGAFVWSTEPTRILSKQNELAFLTAFGNSVMAEWARIDTEIADQKKSDFIGSISHELRSPLHGILASAEFLAETTSGWSAGLVEIIDSCGRTLLDTINHILDYSKINHFEKNWRRSKRADRSQRHGSGGTLALRQSDLPMLSLYQNIDIAILCEEVVESVFAGHVFQNVTAQSFDMVPGARGRMSDAAGSSSPSGEAMALQHKSHPDVVVILDVDVQNYCYNTQPGALRRLVMNLLGNALKYTSHGYVHIKLEAVEMEDFNAPASVAGESVPRSMITLTVADTGKGISPEFLRSKLYTPFAQESSLSSGTGLGLSIVKKIVSLLEGNIRIDSEVGHGTQVRVTLPLLREMPSTTGSTASSSTNQSNIIATRDVDQSIPELQSRVAGQKVSLHGFDLDTPDPVLKETGRFLKHSVINCLVQWYGMKVVPFGNKVSLIVCNEINLASLQAMVSQIPKQKGNPAIVVLCAHDTRFNRTPTLEDSNCNVGYVAKPVGPLKLAKAINSCLDGGPPTATPGMDTSLAHSPENSNLSETFDSLILSPQGGEVLDNSRISVNSLNARKALESPTPQASIEKKSAGFPFPNPPISEEPEDTAQVTILSPKGTLTQVATTITQSASTTLTQIMKSSITKSRKKKPELPMLDSPNFLLVDDNHINMSLLSTFVKRHNFTTVHEAPNGLEAVKSFKVRDQGFDIIFMDITMPVMDGFEATRQIRALEIERREKGSVKKPALVIAFTGRSSMEDQVEAKRVGLDLFMTKPVSLKEVGKIIENWVANSEKVS